MPTKQIYVKESDLAIFSEAEEYVDSLSRLVRQLVSDFVEKKRAEKDVEGYAEIELEIGSIPDNIQLVKFFGTLLAQYKEELVPPWAEWVDQDYADERAREGVQLRSIPSGENTEHYWRIFRTKKRKFLFWRQVCKRMGEDDYQGNSEEIEITNDDKTAEYWIIDELPREKHSFYLGDILVPQQLLEAACKKNGLSTPVWLDI